MQTEFLTLTSLQFYKKELDQNTWCANICGEQVCFLSTWKIPSSRTNHVENCQTKRQDFLFFYINLKRSKNQTVGRNHTILIKFVWKLPWNSTLTHLNVQTHCTRTCVFTVPFDDALCQSLEILEEAWKHSLVTWFVMQVVS